MANNRLLGDASAKEAENKSMLERRGKKGSGSISCLKKYLTCLHQ
jgi:hypothetical protein